MARFTTAEKWGDAWFSDLKPIDKLIFLYLTDRCDNAGFFEINKRVDSFVIGVTEIEYLASLETIKKSYIKSLDGRKIWLKNYLKHQKNLPLNPDNNAHKQIITFISSNLENFEYDFNKLGANKGLFSPPSNVIGNSNVLGNTIKVKNPENGFNQKPKSTDFNGLPDMINGSVIQLFRITKQTDATKSDIDGLWEVFKVQTLTGKKFYADEDAVYSHFINWTKTQTINGQNKQEKKMVI
jgi:hypothetical protein